MKLATMTLVAVTGMATAFPLEFLLKRQTGTVGVFFAEHINWGGNRETQTQLGY